MLPQSLELSDTHNYKMNALQMLGRQNLEIDWIVLPLIMFKVTNQILLLLV